MPERPSASRSPHRPASAALAAVVAALLVCACSSTTGGAGAGHPGVTAPGTATTAATTSPAPTGSALDATRCARATPAACPLKVAAARAGITIGTAGKFSSTAREQLEAQQFSAMSVESQTLWSVVQPAPDRWNFRPADQVVAFARRHHLALTATHFVWDPPSIPSVLPAWVRRIDDPDALRRAMRAYLTALTARYGDAIGRWDTVNEPLALDGTLADNHFRRVLGPGYVEEAFRMAHQIAPHAQLFLNEWGAELIPAKADGLVSLAARLVHEHVPISGVGIQTHLQTGDPNWPLFAATLRRITALGLPVVISELDLPTQPGEASPLEAQAARAAHVVRLCLRTPRCTQITFWGFDDGDTWLDSYLHPGTRPLPFDAALRPKPMFFAVRDALLASPGPPRR
ncbi:MAG TPA: endo-1,4-beta-xylanase [Acidimicrobiales bacterium]